MAKFCGGLKFNPDTFKIEKGIITLIDNEFTTEITADTDHIVQATLTPTE